MSQLTLVRGIPGSGKSTLAKKLAAMQGMTSIHLEADQFFIHPETGIYTWDGMKIGYAHEWCQDQTEEQLFYKFDVFVSNTFTTAKEIRPYLEINSKLNLKRPNIITCQGSFGSIHGVPESTLDAMRKRFLYDLEPLMAEFGY